MAKVIIEISDTEAGEDINCRVNFDPPLKEERTFAQKIALHMLASIEDGADVTAVNGIPTTKEE